jgi:hypothetical protein
MRITKVAFPIKCELCGNQIRATYVMWNLNEGPMRLHNHCAIRLATHLLKDAQGMIGSQVTKKEDWL